MKSTTSIVAGLVLGLSSATFAQGTSPTDATAPKQPVPPATPSVPVVPSTPPDNTTDWTVKLAEVFATTEPVVVAEGLKFAEGPLWWNDRLIVCDLSDSVVYSVTPKEGEVAPLVEFRKPSDNAAGAALDADGHLILAHFAGKVTRTGTDGTVEVIADRMGEIPFGRCNDLVCHPSGVIFFTDFGGKNSKGLFARAADGTVSQVDADYAAANGVALSPDNKSLYVADYGGATLKAYDVDAAGAATNPRTIVSFRGETGRGRADGLKVNADGKVLTTGPGGIWVIDPSGERHSRLPLAGGASNLAIGGADGKTLFITSGTKVLSVKLK